MSESVKKIRTLVEKTTYDCNIPVRENFPVNVIDSRSVFDPRFAVVEIIIIEELAKERVNNFLHVLRQRLGEERYSVDHSYWPPSGKRTGSIVIQMTELRKFNPIEHIV